MQLTSRDKDLCMYTGVFGVMLSLTCLIQHFTYTYPHWIPAVFSLVYILSITSFALLIAQQRIAIILLIINASLLFIALVILIKALIFSLPVIMLVIYSVIIVIVTQVNGLTAKLRNKQLAARAERDLWKDKL